MGVRTRGPANAAPWRPSATCEALRERAALLGRIRAYFSEAGVMEVETPIASRAATTDPALASLATQWHGGGGALALYLQTSPEFAMKRLLAAGVGPIYQLCKVFRDDERGRWHHPEFTLLEWYRPGWDYARLMDEVAELVRLALVQPGLPAERIAYRELFHAAFGIDPWQAEAETLSRLAQAQGIGGAECLQLTRDGWLDLLMSYSLAPRLGRGRLSFVCDYPPSQALLARCREGPAGAVAERFELFVDGVELANGFQELTDAREQRRRFSADLAVRAARGAVSPPQDEAFLAALGAGLPECAGVALGVDRLLMRRLGVEDIDAVLAFPIERA